MASDLLLDRVTVLLNIQYFKSVVPKFEYR